MSDSISLRGVRVHNLCGIDVEIPLRRLTVVSGVSGAGKSSLAFDTLHAEAQRRYLQSFSARARQFLEKFDKPDADGIADLPPAVAITQRIVLGAHATLGSITEISDYLRLLLVRCGDVICPRCENPLKAHTPAAVVAFVEGLPAGTRVTIGFPSRPDVGQPITAWMATLREKGFMRLQVGERHFRLDQEGPAVIEDTDGAWVLMDRVEVGKVASSRLADTIESAFRHGGERLAIWTGETQTLFDRRLWCAACRILYATPEVALLEPVKDGIHAIPEFGVPRVLWAGHDLEELSEMALKELANLFQKPLALGTPGEREASLTDATPAAGVVLTKQVVDRLDYLLDIGLGYLSLGRGASTLSKGELRRVRLTTALASNLVNAMYLFDEPTAGLHAADTAKLLAELFRLRSSGNAVVVVEHDREVWAACDHLIDLGPGAGEEGGRLLYQGPPEALVNDASLTAQYWEADPSLITRKRRPQSAGSIRLSRANINNLKNVTVDFPLGVLCVVTGVSGSGKSSLVEHALFPALQKKGAEGNARLLGGGQIGDAVLMDQQALTRSARSNPATFLKVFDDIRILFAETSDARIRGFEVGTFSFNQAGGRCDVCEGQGTLTVDMQFLADVKMTCPECDGRRYKKEVLEVKVRSLDISQVLDLTVREAFRFFRAQPRIAKRLRSLLDVGLEYLRLGQGSDTLSGGESQRLKLAAHLAQSRKARTLYILLEPTTGLHPADVVRLLDCFDQLLQAGHSLIVVEHNLDVIASADHVIDLGPGAGPEGGSIVATGTPAEVAQVAESATGRCLRANYLE